MKKKCSKCGADSCAKDQNFCHECGRRYSQEEELPYIGESARRGMFQLNYDPVRGEFDSFEEARDVACHASWNEGAAFGGCAVTLIRRTATKDTHPFICGTCKGTSNEVVAKHTRGRCKDCGETNWVERT